MGLIIATSERIKELEDQVEAYKRGIDNLYAENERMQKCYRELRDEKDEAIKSFTDEVNRLNKAINKMHKENVVLREVVSYYERMKKQ